MKGQYVRDEQTLYDLIALYGKEVPPPLMATFVNAESASRFGMYVKIANLSTDMDVRCGRWSPERAEELRIGEIARAYIRAIKEDECETFFNS